MVSPRRLLKLAALSFLVFLLQSIISILPPLFTAPRGSRAPQRRLVSRAASPVIEAWLVQQERDSEYDELLRDGFSRDKMFRFFSRRPHLILRRFYEIGQVLLPAWQVWTNPREGTSRGEYLKGSLQKLGPVFVKVGQTLAQRPDIVGDEAANVLKSLQSKT